MVSWMSCGWADITGKRESQDGHRLLCLYSLIDSVIFVRGLWTTKQGLKGNWPSSWRVTDTLNCRSLILLSLHEAYITNYNTYRVIHHLMDSCHSVFSPSPSKRDLDNRLEYMYTGIKCYLWMGRGFWRDFDLFHLKTVHIVHFESAIIY